MRGRVDRNAEVCVSTPNRIELSADKKPIPGTATTDCGISEGLELEKLATICFRHVKSYMRENTVS